MLSKDQVKLMEKEGKPLLAVGGKHPRPKAARHLGVWYGRQMTPKAPRFFPTAAAGYLRAARSGIYCAPWRRAYEQPHSGEEGSTTAEPGFKIGIDINLLNWLRGPTLVIHVHSTGETPYFLQFTLHYFGALNAKRILNGLFRF